MSDWKVELVEDNISEFHVVFRGPPDSEQPGPQPSWRGRLQRTPTGTPASAVHAVACHPVFWQSQRAAQPAVCGSRDYAWR